MPDEIERTWVVASSPGSATMDKATSSIILQGYIAVADTVEVRIRVRDLNMYTLTVKHGKGLVRQEVEVPIEADKFHELWDQIEDKIKKTRFLIEYGKHWIELDVYGGYLTGLLVAEVEFQSVEDAEAFVPPSWFGKEVTGNSQYNNSRLARYGFPEGKQP